MSQPTMPHDALFRKFLGHPETARDFLEIHLPAPLRALCDLSTLRPEPDSFIESTLRHACSDILHLGIASLTGEQLQSLVEYLLKKGNTTDPDGFTQRLIGLLPDEHKEKMMSIAEQLEQIGLERGLEEGREEERLAIARNLFQLGLPVERIGLVTGLSEAAIQSLRFH